MKIQKENTPLLFDRIYNSYDSLNHLLSLGLDKKWRKKFVKNLKKINPKHDVIVDLASGTGDLLVNLQELNANLLYAIDPSEKMMTIAKSKVSDAEFINGFAEDLPLNENSVDLVAISFGVRNFSDIDRSFSEIHRILKKNGIVSIMEFSVPDFILFKWGFHFYINTFIPLIIKILSKDKQAYKYLRTSIIDFNKNVNVANLLESKNLYKVNIKKLCLGAVKIYSYIKT